MKRVGITTWPRAVPVGSVEEPNETVPRAYVRAVVKAGGLPILLPVVEITDIDLLLDSVDALVVSGGGDIDPASYGEHVTAAIDGVDTTRDAFDIALWKAVLERVRPRSASAEGRRSSTWPSAARSSSTSTATARRTTR